MRARTGASLLVTATMAVASTSACGSDEAAPETSVSTSSPTTSTSTTTSTVWTGPPTLPPGGTLPTPIAPPGPDEVDPDVLMGTMEIPALMMSSPIYEGITDPTFDRGVGWWPGTARPGEPGNVVLGGHRTSAPRPFRHLELLAPGDEIVFAVDDDVFVYRVTRTEVVTPEAMWIVDQTPTATATLFACHPPGSTKERIVVFAEFDRRA
jgi:sortase A